MQDTKLRMTSHIYDIEVESTPFQYTLVPGCVAWERGTGAGMSFNLGIRKW